MYVLRLPCQTVTLENVGLLGSPNSACSNPPQLCLILFICADNRYNNDARSRWSSNPTNDDFRKLVAAGWPEWLAIVAGEALNGWLPCEAGAFKKLGKVGIFYIFLCVHCCAFIILII